MGIFGKMRKSAARAPLLPEFDGTITPWSCPPCVDTVAMDVDVAGKFRSLWPNALCGVNVGEWIWLEAIPGDVALPKRFDDYIFASKQDMLLAYRYNGVIVGVSASCYANVRALLESGYRVFCRGHKLGMYSAVTPEIELYTSFKPDGFQHVELGC